jgi:hypothetical protein
VAQPFIQPNNKSKNEWTNELYHLAHGEDAFIPNINQKNIYILYWYNNNKNFGFRLNNTAFELMRSYGYKFYEHHIDRRKYQINGKELVLMDRYHAHPWFYQMSKGELFLMDSELSMMIELCGGDLSQAIQNMS